MMMMEVGKNFQEETRAGQQWITQPPTHQISPHHDDEDNSDDEGDGDNDGDGGDEEGWRRSQEGWSGQQWEQHHTTLHTQYFSSMLQIVLYLSIFIVYRRSTLTHSRTPPFFSLRGLRTFPADVIFSS